MEIGVEMQILRKFRQGLSFRFFSQTFQLIVEHCKRRMLHQLRPVYWF